MRSCDLSLIYMLILRCCCVFFSSGTLGYAFGCPDPRDRGALQPNSRRWGSPKDLAVEVLSANGSPLEPSITKSLGVCLRGSRPSGGRILFPLTLFCSVTSSISLPQAWAQNDIPPPPEGGPPSLTRIPDFSSFTRHPFRDISPFRLTS